MIIIIIIGCLLLGTLLGLLITYVSRRSGQAKEMQAQLTTYMHQNQLSLGRLEERTTHHQQMVEGIHTWLNEQQRIQQQERTKLDEYQVVLLKTLQESMFQGMTDVRQQMTTTLNAHAQTINQRMAQLTATTDQHLKDISGHVDKRLSEGFEKTTATFTDVVKRLSLIDEAQKKITELSANVVSLQAVFTDKRARGAFGEIQLADLVRNVLPETHFELQATLSNGKRIDCLLKLPPPSGNLCIDSKFPLENYRLMLDLNLADTQRHQYQQLFKKDIQKHLQDISEKYIVAGETADSAIMFIPAESIFSEIHAHYPELVEMAYKAKVWLTSPTTLWAILTTARAVIKDVATRNQVHVIQTHLVALNKEFDRFKGRMENLAKHIEQAHRDTQDVHTTSKKISSRFNAIERVEWEEEP